MQSLSRYISLAVLLISLSCFGQAFTMQDTAWLGNAAPVTAVTYSYPSYDYVSFLLNSNYWATQQITSQYTTFGGPGVWDGVSNVFRGMMMGSSDNKLYEYTSPDGMTWSDRSLALDVGAAGTYDAGGVGVPFIWNEVGQSRPWRMLYRGAKTTSYTICLATSTNGWNWERIDTSGSAITSCVITNPADTIDFGNVFKVSSTYYVYWSSLTPPRKTYLSTSTDLLAWTQQTSGQTDKAYFWGATNVAGAWDYDDKTHSSSGRSTAGQGFGWYCPWVGRWDKDGGTTEYRMYIVAMRDSSKSAVLCFSSPLPDFNVTNRTYLGVVIDSAIGHKVANNAVTDYDTPRVYCDDITQKPASSYLMGSNILMWVSGLSASWREVVLSRPSGLELPIYNPTTSGATVNAVQYILDNTNVMLHLALNGDTNTVYQFQPGKKAVVNDLAGYGVDVIYPGNGYVPLDTNGVLLTRASNEYMGYTPAAHLAQLDAVSNAFTIEFTAQKNTTVGAAAFASPFAASADTGKHVCYVYLAGSAGDTAVTWNVSVTDTGGTTRNFATAAFDWSDNSRHTWAFMRTNNVMYWFKDGAVQAIPGGAFNYVIKTQTGADPIRIGSKGGSAGNYWGGYVDEVRLSSCGRYATNGYTVATLPINYTTTGYIFTRVYDFGSSVSGATCTTYGTTPAGCSVSVTHRAAASATDKSVTVGDFGANAAGQWHQFLITLTGSGSNSAGGVTNSPTITGLKVTSP